MNVNAYITLDKHTGHVMRLAIAPRQHQRAIFASGDDQWWVEI
jgi:hypothetical protein